MKGKTKLIRHGCHCFPSPPWPLCLYRVLYRHSFFYLYFIFMEGRLALSQEIWAKKLNLFTVAMLSKLIYLSTIKSLDRALMTCICTTFCQIGYYQPWFHSMNWIFSFFQYCMHFQWCKIKMPIYAFFFKQEKSQVKIKNTISYLELPYADLNSWNKYSNLGLNLGSTVETSRLTGKY